MQYLPGPLPKQSSQTRESETPTMSDQAIIDQAVESHQAGYQIDDGEARVIAAAWHGGISSAMYAFVSTGAILPALPDEIRDDMSEETPELEALLAHVERIGERKPVPDWSSYWG